ncbi:MAG: Do family serine endopeptidase [Geminicoccaceae bacterium]
MLKRLVPFVLALLLLVPAASAETVRQVPESAPQVQLSFAPIVKRVVPAVVSVTSRKEVAGGRDQFLDDPFFNFFFRDFGGGQPQPQVQQSLGSGVLVRADGLIVTNHHVVDGADAIEVVLADRRSFPAKLVTTDERSDLAFLKIDPGRERLPTLPLGDSDAIEVGDLVLAVGNPFGIGQTVTGGIISATARTAPQLDSDVSFLQTDAAVNPGNSGGALVDMRGSLVGINTAIFSRSGGSIGIGFAIPANLVKARMAALDGKAEGGRLARPWLGAQLQPVDPDIAASLGLDRPRGVLVRQVYPGAAADRAGLRGGDIVLAVDGVEVVDPAGLGYRVSLRRMGDKAGLEVWRRGRTVAAALPVEAAPRTPAPETSRLDGDLAGATVANLSPAFNEELGLDMFDAGVVVLEVQRGSRAQAMRLRPGDRIVGVNEGDVASVAELRRALRGPLHRLDIDRGGQRFAVTLAG